MVQYVDPTTLRAEMAAGSAVEDDNFVVNDVPLTIPPEQISIQRESFMNEWQTLRTAGSRRAKSGHSLVSISLPVVFHDNESINFRLRPLVAGLRAFPFFTVQNKYLYDQLGELQGQVEKSYQQFKPMVFALTSMTFSTMPRQPGVIYGQLNAMWFNYYPYTPIWAYRSGEDYESPGPVWQSELWKKFYEPFLAQTDLVNWPHIDPSLNPLMIRYRDFLVQWNGTPEAAKAAIKLVDTLKNKPSEALSTFHSVNGRKDTTGSNALSRWYQALYEKGLISGQEKFQLNKLQDGQLEKSAGDILYPLLRQTYGKAYQDAEIGQRSHASGGPVPSVSSPLLLVAGTAGDINKWRNEPARLKAAYTPAVNANLSAINAAGSELVNRYKKSLEQSQQNSAITWKEIKEFSSQVVFSNKKDGTKIDVGGYKVWGRKRHIKIAPRDPNGLGAQDPGFVLEGMSITIAPNITVIPLIGHNHPTAQFTGGYDAELSITVNAANGDMKLLSRAYDRWENNNLKYRRIPQGFRNLTIENDFVQLFGMSEWMSKSFHSTTIHEQPGRSRGVLSLVDAGITSNDQEDDPELLKQEYIGNDAAVRREVWNILFKNLRHKEKGSSWYLLDFATDADLRNKSFGALVKAAADYYNIFIQQMKQKLFPFGGFANAKAATTYGDFQSLGDTDLGEVGFVPGLEKLQRTLKLMRDSGPDKGKSLKGRTWKDVKDKIKRRDYLANITQSPNTGEDPDFKGRWVTLEEMRVDKLNRLNDLGLRTYQKSMLALLDRIIHTPSLKDLPQFKHIRTDANGVGKGGLAYPDFKKSLRNMASFLDASATDSSLTEYDPDFFLWYPMLNGSLQNPTTGIIIDPFLISQAKLHSQQIFDNAQGDVGDFFQKIYRQKLAGGNNKAPIKALDHYDAKELARPFVENKTYKNTLLNDDLGAGQKIQVTVSPDPHKTPINYYDNPKPTLLCNDSIVHSTSLNDLWGDVPVETGSAQQNKDKSKPITTGPVNNKGGLRQSFYPWGRARTSKTIKKFVNDMLAACEQLGLSPNSAMILTAHAASSSGWGRSAENYRLCGVKAGARYRARGGAYVERPGWECVKKGRRRGSRVKSTVGCPPGTERKYTPMYWRAYDSLKDSVQDILNILRNKRYEAAYRSLTNGDISYFKDLRKGGWYTADPNVFHADAMRRLSMIRNIAKGKKRYRELATQPVAKDITTTLTSPLRSAINEFEKRLIKGQAQRVVRALPTFKLYFIEDDSGNRNRLGFDDFFSYNAVKSIKVVKSRKIAADVCIIEMTNVSGTLSNRKYRNEKDAGKPRDETGKLTSETKAYNNPSLKDTIQENPIASLMLQQGMDIHLKLGYSSDPSMLEPVFTGRIQIVEFSDTDDFVVIVAQSHATELTQDIKAIEEIKEKSTFGLMNWNVWGFGDNATTGRIFEEMLAQPEVVHFGRWERGDETLNRSLLTNKFQFVPQPSDDNIFAPPPSVDLDAIGEGLFFKNISFFMYRNTIWDIFKEMELRHPNYIGSPVPYSAGGANERMTYFFGMPNQLYFARAPAVDEQGVQNKLQQDAEAIKETIVKQTAKLSSLRQDLKKVLDTKVAGIPLTGLPTRATLEAFDNVYKAAYNASPVGRAVNKTVNEIYRKKRLLLAKEAGYIKPFRNYHLFTSNTHIVANNIRADARDVANTIAIKYPQYKVEVKPNLMGLKTAVSKTNETFILKLDNALPTEDIRTQVADCVNARNDELAKRYALGLMCRGLKDVYKGSLTVIGDPSIKPYDVAYLFDEVSDIVGPIEVEQVIQWFDRDKGFLSEITPDMVVMASEWSLLGSLEALSIVMEGVIKKVWGNSNVDNSRGKDPQFSPWSFMLAGALHLTGGMTAKKIINYTQLGQPVIMSPLLHHGREFSGGVPTRKIPGSVWDTMFGTWKSEADESYHAWLEDVSDNIDKSIRKYTGRESVGSVLDGWTSNTVESE